MDHPPLWMIVADTHGPLRSAHAATHTRGVAAKRTSVVFSTPFPTAGDSSPPGRSPRCSGTARHRHLVGYGSSVTAILTLLVVLALSLVVTRVATVALTATGLSREAARFQARSAFSGAGFTTTESESVVRHPVRRQVIMWLMLAGNAGIVAAMASIVLAAAQAGGDLNAIVRVAAVVAGILAIWWASRTAWVDRRITRLAGIALRRWTHLDVNDYAALLRVGGEYIVTELQVEAGSWLADRSLFDLALRDEGIIVLGVERLDGSYLGAPQGDTVLVAGDLLVLYSRSEDLVGLDRRQRGEAGDRAHAAAVEAHARTLAEEHAGGTATTEPTTAATATEDEA